MNFIFTVLISFLFSINTDKDIVSYKADCVTMTDDGIVTLLIWDIDSGKKYKPEQAEKDAVAFVMYEGFKGGKCGYVSPLLKSYESKYEFENSHAYFFKKAGNCLDYVVSSKVSIEKPIQVGDQSWSVYEVVVNKKMLDEYLVGKEIKNKIDIY